MSLEQYNRKRNFQETDEPEGKKSTSAQELLFVVQKHATSHLHYDFRLEMEGVLKTVIFPKAISVNLCNLWLTTAYLINNIIIMF